MKELDFYKFIQENGIEIRWDDDILSAWIPAYLIVEFSKLCASALSEDGIEARLITDGFIWVDLVPIFGFYGVDPLEIHSKKTAI